MIASRDAGGPEKLLVMSTGAEIAGIQLVETSSRKTEPLGSAWGLDFLGPERSQHMTN